MLSKTERQFLLDVLAGKATKYSYHYRKVLRKRVLDKRKQLTEDIYLIAQAEEKLKEL